MIQYLTCSTSKRIALVTAIEQKGKYQFTISSVLYLSSTEKKNTMNSLNDL